MREEELVGWSELSEKEIKKFRDDGTVITTKVKGGLEHEHPLPHGCQMALEVWFDVRGRSGQYLFNPITKKVEIDIDRGLSGRGTFY